MYAYDRLCKDFLSLSLSMVPSPICLFENECERECECARDRTDRHHSIRETTNWYMYIYMGSSRKRGGERQRRGEKLPHFGLQTTNNNSGTPWTTWNIATSIARASVPPAINRTEIGRREVEKSNWRHTMRQQMILRLLWPATEPLYATRENTVHWKDRRRPPPRLNQLKA